MKSAPSLERAARTEWFPPEITPVREGWYPRKYDGDLDDSCQYMNYWDGKNWHYNDDVLSNVPATKPGDVCPCNQWWLWRGLAEEVK